MASNRRQWLGPASYSMRDPTSNAKEHGRMRNVPRYNEVGGRWQSRGVSRNDKKLGKPGDTV
jgi:hypothetical protein